MGSRCAGAMVMGMGLGEFTARRDRTARSVCSGVIYVCVCVCWLITCPEQGQLVQH